jgi:hypothetical protein
MAIKVKPDKDGRIIINLYGKEIEVSEKEFDENGCATIKRFGETYELKLNKPAKKKATKPKKIEIQEESSEESLGIDYEEMPIKE